MRILSFFCALAVLKTAVSVSLSKRSGDASWGYHYLTEGELGPSRWWEADERCNGHFQSPINLLAAEAKSQCLGEIELDGFGDEPPEGATMTLTNTGHYVKIKLTGNYLVTGGGLGSVYKSDQFHFHWGMKDSRGSEHYLEGSPYPAEMHIVTYDTARFSSEAEAVGKDRGLAVLGFFVELVDEDNPAFEPLLTPFENIELEGDAVQLDEPFSIESVLPEDRSKFFRYMGSLTTPPCAEGVVWTNFKNTVKMSASQLQRFRDLKDELDLNMQDNFRPIQRLNNRKLFDNTC
ncbi:carbonic anhydrase 9-like [Ptychodera flava]|uniref:carbonic anhydrase 9-like n=1 Tax=Ptychodera flava TaxID=63121 RepID=UPI00396A3813